MMKRGQASIKIAAVHPDITGPERLRLGEPRLNSEWVELVNAGSQAVNVSQHFVVNGAGQGFTISLPRRKTLLIGPFESLLIFSGFPDNPEDAAACYLANQTTRLFLRLKAYFWNPQEDRAFLYPSREIFLENPHAYLDHYHYVRRSARVFVSH